MQTPLVGRVAIITGANQGIGAACARHLAAAGAAVAVAAYAMTSGDHPDGRQLPESYAARRAQTAGDTVADIVADGGRAVPYALDLRNPDAIPMLFDAVEAELGPVDTLINNASAWWPDTFTLDETDSMHRRVGRVSAATFDHVFGVDARGSALMLAEFTGRYLGRGAEAGWVVGLTSGGEMGFPGEATYGAAKAAMESYTMTAGVELQDRGLRVNTLHPPATDTGWLSPEVRAAIEANGGSIATPDAVAERVVALCIGDTTLQRVLMT